MQSTNKILDYYLALPEPQQQWAFTLHHFIVNSIPNCKVEFKYGSTPFYMGKSGAIAYITLLRKSMLTIGFAKGAALEDVHQILQGEQKIVRHYYILKDDDVSPNRLSQLKDYFIASIAMDENGG